MRLLQIHYAQGTWSLLTYTVLWKLIVVSWCEFIGLIFLHILAKMAIVPELCSKIEVEAAEKLM